MTTEELLARLRASHTAGDPTLAAVIALVAERDALAGDVRTMDERVVRPLEAKLVQVEIWCNERNTRAQAAEAKLAALNRHRVVRCARCEEVLIGCIVNRQHSEECPTGREVRALEVKLAEVARERDDLGEQVANNAAERDEAVEARKAAEAKLARQLNEHYQVENEIKNRWSTEVAAERTIRQAAEAKLAEAEQRLAVLDSRNIAFEAAQSDRARMEQLWRQALADLAAAEVREKALRGVARRAVHGAGEELCWCNVWSGPPPWAHTAECIAARAALAAGKETDHG